MNKLQIQVLLSAVDKMTAPLRTVESQIRKFSQALKENKDSSFLTKSAVIPRGIKLNKPLKPKGLIYLLRQSN